MFVNDGIQDCCDCSDEPGSSCVNTCDVLNRERLLIAKEHQKGYRKKMDLIEGGLTLRKQKQDELEALKVEQLKVDAMVDEYNEILKLEVIEDGVTYKEQELKNALIKMYKAANDRFKEIEEHYKKLIEYYKQKGFVDPSEEENFEDFDDFENPDYASKSQENSKDSNPMDPVHPGELTYFELENSIPYAQRQILDEAPKEPKELPSRRLCDKQSQSFFDCLSETFETNLGNLY